MMTPRELRIRLEKTGRAISALFAGVDAAEAVWKPAEERWSLVEVAGHLGDEERSDFRTRLRSLVENPTRPWPQIDPMGWVTSRAYASMAIGEAVKGWELERAASLEWLASVREIDPAIVYGGPWPHAQPIRSGDLMLSWIAHDCYHIRQIARLRWEHLEAGGAPYSTRYAGREE